MPAVRLGPYYPCGEIKPLDGVDPMVTSWGLSAIGWVLVILPFALLGAGYVVSRLRTSVNEELLRDVLS